MKEKEPLSLDLKQAVLAIARLRINLRRIGDSSRASVKRKINETITNFPQLSTQRAIAFFPQDGHLEIAKNLLMDHTEVWEKRGQDCRESGLRFPTVMVSGEFFEIDGEKFLKLDAPVTYFTENNLQKLAEAEYTVLLPSFKVHSLASNTGVEI